MVSACFTQRCNVFEYKVNIKLRKVIIAILAFLPTDVQRRDSIGNYVCTVVLTNRVKCEKGIEKVGTRD